MLETMVRHMMNQIAQVLLGVRTQKLAGSMHMVILVRLMLQSSTALVLVDMVLAGSGSGEIFTPTPIRVSLLQQLAVCVEAVNLSLLSLLRTKCVQIQLQAQMQTATLLMTAFPQ